ncbi:MAG TPA: PaaI family thioesterase [Desulfitobacteriaceae bacterium]|nr:PaaI family thioesterase [Desulfitobacteriaceae bacterium]
MRDSRNLVESEIENLGLDPEIYSRILGFYEDNYFGNYIGTRLMGLGPGKAVIRLTAENYKTNTYCTLHGGAVATLADISMGLACITKGIIPMTGNINISFLAAGEAGNEITAVGNVNKTGKKVFFAETSITDENGKLIATGTGTFFYKKTFAGPVEL